MWLNVKTRSRELDNSGAWRTHRLAQYSVQKNNFIVKHKSERNKNKHSFNDFFDKTEPFAMFSIKFEQIQPKLTMTI